MEIISVGSSSSGNSYIIKVNNKAIVLDAGLSCIKITRALEASDMDVSDVESILITHEHVDHVKSVRTLVRKCQNATVYVSHGTYENSNCFNDIDENRICFIGAGGECPKDDFIIRAFPLNHDAAEPIGFSVIHNDEKLSVVTDTGIVTEDIFEEIKDADTLVLEANHDEDLLMYGSYPYRIKLRIKSDEGHLSNRAAGELLAELLNYRNANAENTGNTGGTDKSASDADEDGSANIIETESKSQASPAPASNPLAVMLSHLSFHNNAPFRARSTIEDILTDAGFKRDVHYTLTIAAKDELTVFP